MFVFCLSLLANGKGRAFLSQIIRVQHVPPAPSPCCWAAGVNHGNSWHARFARVQVYHQRCGFYSPLLKTKQKKKPWSYSGIWDSHITSHDRIPSGLHKQQPLMTRRAWFGRLSMCIQSCLRRVRVADTLTPGTDRIPPGPTAGGRVKYALGHLKWL